MPTVPRRPAAQRQRQQFEARRLRAAELLAAGVRQAEIARQLGISAQAVSVWHRRWGGGGTKALCSKGPSGPAPPRDPACPLVVEAIRGQLPPGVDPDALVFTGPGGGNHVAAGAGTVLSRNGVRRMYQTAVKRADLDHLDLRGPHDFRHTFSTWLEDAGIPARVIDELMGHQRSRHGAVEGGSRIGARYRHTTDAMAVRVVQAIQERLTIALRMAQDAQAERQGSTRVW
jgi:integrase